MARTAPQQINLTKQFNTLSGISLQVSLRTAMVQNRLGNPIAINWGRVYHILSLHLPNGDTVELARNWQHAEDECYDSQDFPEQVQQVLTALNAAADYTHTMSTFHALKHDMYQLYIESGDE